MTELNSNTKIDDIRHNSPALYDRNMKKKPEEQNNENNDPMDLETVKDLPNDPNRDKARENDKDISKQNKQYTPQYQNNLT